MTRVAAVDLGTNSTRLLVADVSDGHIEEVVRRSVVTRLGEGVDARRRLLPVPVARVRNVLTDFRRELEALGAERTLAVATSAVRDAENGEAFLGEIEWSYGFKTKLLSGEDEAQLTRRGVGAAGGLGTLLLDVGGGSTELSTKRFATSLDVGSVRLTERYLHGDPPTRLESARARAAVKQLLPPLDGRATRSASRAPSASWPCSRTATGSHGRPSHSSSPTWRASRSRPAAASKVSTRSAHR